MFLKFIKKKNYLQITKKQLLNFSIFLGHSKKKWCKNYTVFIFGFRNNLILINLDYIFYMVTRSLVFIQLLIKFYGNICALSNFVNYNFCGLTQFFLERNFYSFYDGRYIGGLVSNIFHIKNTKKKMLYDFFMNINKLRLLPSCFLIFDSNIFYSCFNEAAFLGIPSIGFLDTDLNFTNCLYPIVGNNESLFIYFYYLIILVFLRKKNVVSRKLKFFNFLLYIYIYILKYKFYFILINFSKNNVKFINFFKFCFFKYKITFNFFLRKFFFYQNTLYAIDLVIRMLKITIYARIIFLLKFLKKFKNKRFLKKKFIMFFLKSLKFFFAFKYDNYLMQKKKFKSKNFLVIKNNNKRLRLLFKKKYFYSFKLYIKLVSFFYAKKLFFLSLRKIFKLKTKFSFLYRLKYTFILQKLVSFYKKKIFLLDNFFYLTKKFKTSTALFRLNHLKRLKNKKKLFLKKNNFKIKKTKKFNFKFTLKKKRKILKYFNKLKKNSQFNFLNLKLVSNKYFIKFFTFFFFKKKLFKRKKINKLKFLKKFKKIKSSSTFFYKKKISYNKFSSVLLYNKFNSFKKLLNLYSNNFFRKKLLDYIYIYLKNQKKLKKIKAKKKIFNKNFNLKRKINLKVHVVKNLFFRSPYTYSFIIKNKILKKKKKYLKFNKKHKNWKFFKIKFPFIRFDFKFLIWRLILPKYLKWLIFFGFKKKIFKLFKNYSQLTKIQKLLIVSKKN